jgi:hypothetical protein
MKKYLFTYLSLLIAMPVSAAKLAMPTDAPKSYDAECASCHMAYPPSLLGRKNWQNIILGLDKHFGSDASLDVKTHTEISQWLANNASTQKKFSAFAPNNRITKSAWFIHEHDEVKAEVWQRDGIKSPSNCLVCHKDATTRGFDEDNIRIPPK